MVLAGSRLEQVVGALVVGHQLSSLGSQAQRLIYADGSLSAGPRRWLSRLGWQVLPLTAWRGAAGWDRPGGRPCDARWSPTAMRGIMGKLMLYDPAVPPPGVRSVLLLDSDLALFANPDALLALAPPEVPLLASHRAAGCGGALCGANQTGTNPNAGVLVLRPSAANFAAVERAARAMRACPKYPEQGVLETAFAGQLRWVSRSWNSRERGAKVGSEHATPFAHGVAHARAHVAIFHFVGKCQKPASWACRWHKLGKTCERGKSRFIYEHWWESYQAVARALGAEAEAQLAQMHSKCGPS